MKKLKVAYITYKQMTDFGILGYVKIYFNGKPVYAYHPDWKVVTVAPKWGYIETMTFDRTTDEQISIIQKMIGNVKIMVSNDVNAKTKTAVEAACSFDPHYDFVI